MIKTKNIFFFPIGLTFPKELNQIIIDFNQIGVKLPNYYYPYIYIDLKVSNNPL